ncbi:unnamed protein product, partial [Gordionus sp. m RMFG-2023]
HKDQVLHVNFSHDGKMFATCSKDGFIKVWNMSSFPIITLKYSFDLKLYNWKYTQYSCFNADDTLLLVSGVHFGSHSTSGEIAVFNVIDGQFTLQCRVINRPYDVFGTWYNEDYLISGNLHWFGHLLSCSSLWINKAWQETDSELETVVMRTFKFFNVNGSSVRNIMVCDCLTSLPTKENQINVDSDAQLSETDANHNYQIDNRIKTNEQNEIPPWASTSVDLPTSSSGSSTSSTSTLSSANLKDPRNSKRSLNDSRKHALNGDKYLVFTTGSKTYVPHQIGFKLIKPIKLPTISQALAILNPSSSAHRDNRDYPETVGLETDADTIHDYNPLIYRGARSFPNNEFQNYPEQMDFDSIDHLIDFNGHIIGMTFSPDQKYLYVNVRCWPDGCIISNPLNPPPIAQEIEIRVVDMSNLQIIDNQIFTSHKAYTHNEECFFLFLDVSDEYLASGAEDKSAYIWDRYYENLCVAKLPHSDIVNCVSFDPTNSQIMITTTDDNYIKVWVSRRLFRDIKIQKSEMQGNEQT